MSIHFNCDCGKGFRVSEKHAGRHAKCPDCGKVLVVPQVDTSSLSSSNIPSQTGSVDNQNPDRAKKITLRHVLILLGFVVIIAVGVVCGIVVFSGWEPDPEPVAILWPNGQLTIGKMTIAASSRLPVCIFVLSGEGTPPESGKAKMLWSNGKTTSAGSVRTCSSPSPIWGEDERQWSMLFFFPVARGAQPERMSIPGKNFPCQHVLETKFVAYHEPGMLRSGASTSDELLEMRESDGAGIDLRNRSDIPD